MGNYRGALALAQRTGGPPDITQTRRRGAEKWGWGVNLEQALSSDGTTGAFARFGWSDGATETFTFTEAERTATAGTQVSGRWWNRDKDRWGLGFGMNDVGNAHAAYLAAGGVGFMLGDGRLRRRPETFVETYYLLQLVRWFGLTLDYQFIANPGYNRDRGPVSVIALRAHLEGAASSAH
jgi:carbohydrate-selective porin OprB